MSSPNRPQVEHATNLIILDSTPFLCTRNDLNRAECYSQTKLLLNSLHDTTEGQLLSRPPPHCPRSDIVVNLLAAVIVVARAVDLVVLVSGEAPVPVGAGAVTLSVMSPFLQHNQRRTRSLPHGRVIRLRLGIGGNIPRKRDARREGAALLAALPDVVRLGGARVGDDAGVFAGDGVAEGAAVGVVGAVLHRR